MKGEKRDKKNWCYWTWKQLKDLHLEHVWESERLDSKVGRNFENLVRKLLWKREEEEWRERMEKRSKLRLYRKLKTKLGLGDYVDYVKTSNYVKRRN